MNGRQSMIFGACGGALYGVAYKLYRDGLVEAVALLAVLCGLVSLMHVFQTWRKTGLLLATLAQAIATGMFLGVGLLVFTDRFAPSSAPTLSVLVVLGVAGPLLFLLESRRSPRRWQAWKRSTRRASLLEILSGDHIPHVRDA